MKSLPFYLLEAWKGYRRSLPIQVIIGRDPTLGGGTKNPSSEHDFETTLFPLGTLVTVSIMHTSMVSFLMFP